MDGDREFFLNELKIENLKYIFIVLIFGVHKGTSVLFNKQEVPFYYFIRLIS